MGRKKDPIRDQVEKLNDKVFKCKYCGEEFAGGASRIKAHLSGIEGKGIRICTRFLKDSQIEGSSTFGDSNKTPCRSFNPCNPQQDFLSSSQGNTNYKVNNLNAQADDVAADDEDDVDWEEG